MSLYIKTNELQESEQLITTYTSMAAVILANPVAFDIHETMPLDTGVLQLDQDFTADETEGTNDAPKPAPIKRDDVYRAKLEEYILHESNLVIDFSSLKTCLDPMGLAVVPTSTIAATADEESTGTTNECDYSKLVYYIFEKKNEKMTSLQKLVLREIPLPHTPNELDNYLVLCHGMLQLSHLRELDISGNKIPHDLQCNLQLWNMQNLRKLLMDNTSLQTLHPSVGRLRKLEVLSLSNNKLKNLPVTLQFCENLRILNLQQNLFTQLPGVVLHLPKLEELRRLNNPLTAQYDMPAPIYVRCHTHTHTNTATAKEMKFNPDSLQTLCTKTIFSSKLDYWQQTFIGPLQCKTLDRLAETFACCEQCGRAISKPEYIVEVLLMTFLELSGVTFKLNVCSKNCQDKIREEYSTRNIQLQKEADIRYEQSIKEAQRLFINTDIDISPEAINAPRNEVQAYRGSRQTRRRRRHKCAIM